jgi:hypothetical protein
MVGRFDVSRRSDEVHKVNIVLGDPVEVISIWTGRMLYCEPIAPYRSGCAQQRG